MQSTVLKTESREKFYRLPLFIVLMFSGLIFGVFLLSSSNSPASPAYACEIGDTWCEDNGGGGNPVVPSAGQGGYDESSWEDVEPWPANRVEVRCDNWGGSGSWKKSTVCNMSQAEIKERIVAHDTGLPERATYRLIMTGGNTCAPSGVASAYSRYYDYTSVRHVKVIRSYAWMWDGLWNAGYYGYPGWGIDFGIPGWNGGSYEFGHTNNGYSSVRYNFFEKKLSLNRYDLYVTPQWCNYPSRSIGESFNCYYGYGGDAYWSQNRNTIASGGTLSKSRGTLPGDPSAPVWNGSTDSAPSCGLTSKQGRPYVSIGINPDDTSNGGATTHFGYAYYRLVPYYQQRYFERADYNISGSAVMPNQTVLREWSSTSASNNTSRLYNAGWYAYSCLRGTEGRFGSSGALPDRNAYFAVGACPSVVTEWRCEIANPTTVGVNRASLPPNSSYYGSTSTVMRNGEQVDLRFADVRIVDTSRGRVDVTNGNAGPTVRNVTNIAYRDLVKSGSTPMLGSDVNSNDQYFKLWPTKGANNTQTWGAWRNSANQNVNKAISFNWSGETASGRFVAQREWRVTAEFLVARAGGQIVGDSNGGGGASVSYEWVRDTQNCYERNSNGTPNTSRMLTSESNPVAVTRAVNNPEG